MKFLVDTQAISRQQVKGVGAINQFLQMQIFQILIPIMHYFNYIPKNLFPSMYYPMTSNSKALVVVIDAPCSHWQSSQKKVPN
jgi:hypothetical protein